jgi:hypothetical protein
MGGREGHSRDAKGKGGSFNARGKWSALLMIEDVSHPRKPLCFVVWGYRQLSGAKWLLVDAKGLGALQFSVGAFIGARRG